MGVSTFLFILLATFTVYYLYSKDSSELSSLNMYFKTLKSKLPTDQQEKLKEVRIHLTDTNIGYCVNGKDIWVFKSYGKHYTISQTEVLIHEMTHILSGETQHTKYFWKWYKYLKSLS